MSDVFRQLVETLYVYYLVSAMTLQAFPPRSLLSASQVRHPSAKPP